MEELSLADQLRLIADKLDGVHTADPTAPPPGMVAVRPTGPEGQGKVRFYPEPVPGENAWGYCTRVSGIKDKNGTPYYPPNIVSTPLNYLLESQSFIPSGFPEVCDYIQHKRDWWPQWYLDVQGTGVDNSGVRFSPN